MASYSQEFIELLRRQDPKTFEKLYQETADQFFRYCQTYYFLDDSEINDIISDFFVKIWSLLPTLKHDYNLNAFLWTVFKNSCKDYFKKSKEHYWTDEQLQSRAQDPEDTDPEQLDILEQSFQFEQIKQALSQLDPVSQEIIHLKFIEHQSYENIAQITHLSESNVRQKCSRWLRQLQSLLATTL